MQAKCWHREVVLAIGLICLPATAAELGERRLTLGGFGTLGAAWQDSSGVEFRRGVHQPEGVESGELDFAVDSVAGLQLNAAWNSQLEAVAQVVSRLEYDNSWRPRISRGFLRYTPDEPLMLRVGRIGWELLPRADSREIGYSYLSLRPPVEIFGLLPSDHFDGADLLLKRPLAGGIARLKVYGGYSSGEIAHATGPNTDLSGSKLWGGQLEYLYGDLEVRIGHGVYLVEDRPPVDPLVAALRQAGTPESNRLADDLARKGRQTYFSFFGLAYDAGSLQVTLALATADRESLPGPKVNFGNLTVGYVMGKFTPYVSASAIDSYADIRSTGLPDTPDFAPLNSAARAIQEIQQHEQKTFSLGLRYDVAPKVDLKFQVDRVLFEHSELVLDRRSPPGRPGDMTVFGLAFDFVF